MARFDDFTDLERIVIVEALNAMTLQALREAGDLEASERAVVVGDLLFEISELG
jgi:hypothetical protein